jgi:hypothetical protein
MFFGNRLILHGVLYGALSIGLLFVAIEEISWGQRILNIATPAYLEQHNTQKEISLHNLHIVQSKLHTVYILVGAHGAFAWVFLARFFPISKAKCRHVVNYLVPDWFISPYFFFTCFIYMLLEYFYRPYPSGFLVWKDQEAVELLLSIGFFSFVITNYLRLQHCLAKRST